MAMDAIFVDAYSQIFRGFYAIRFLSNSKNEPTNAIFAFAKLLMQLEREFPSPYGGMAFDRGKVQFRLEILPEYKGNRPPTPELLLLQIPRIRTLAELFGWPLIEEDNFEADDLIAGGSGLFSGREVGILSSDKDLAQLVKEHVRLLRPARPSGFEFWGEDEVVSGFGVRPEQIVDYLALLGDSSDNIPGVAGIGKKGAAAILAECGSLTAFYDNPGLVSSEKNRQRLLDGRELVEKNRRLIKLRGALPEHYSKIERWLRRNPDWNGIRREFEELEFGSLLKELPPPEPELSQGLFNF